MTIVGQRLTDLEKEIEHLTKVTQMHRRIIDMLVKDMVLLKPNKSYLQVKEQADD